MKLEKHEISKEDLKIIGKGMLLAGEELVGYFPNSPQTGESFIHHLKIIGFNETVADSLHPLSTCYAIQSIFHLLRKDNYNLKDSFIRDYIEASVDDKTMKDAQYKLGKCFVGLYTLIKKSLEKPNKLGEIKISGKPFKFAKILSEELCPPPPFYRPEVLHPN